MSKREIKSMTIILMVLLVLVSLSCVSAQDNSDIASDAADNISDTGSPVLQLSEGEDVLGDGADGTFADLATEINKGEAVVSLDKNYTYSSTDGDYANGILIDRSVAIIGNGFTINANGAARIFNITSG